MRRFEYVDSKSSKFWEIEQEGSSLNIRWGKIGTLGQSQSKPFADDAKASATMGKLVTEKTGKGYVEVDIKDGARIGSSPARATPTPAIKVDSTKAVAATASLPEQAADIAPVNLPPANPDALVASESSESIDAQTERALIELLKQMVDGVIAEKAQLSIARMCKDYGISQAAANHLINRATIIGIGWNTGNALFLGNKFSTEAAQAHLNILTAEQQKNSNTHTGQAVDTRTLAPWLCNGIPLHVEPELKNLALASRRFPQKTPPDDATHLWSRVQQIWAEIADLNIPESDAALALDLQKMEQRLKARQVFEKNPATDSLILAFALSFSKWKDELPVSFSRLLVTACGLPYAVDCFLNAMAYRVLYHYEQGFWIQVGTPQPFSHGYSDFSTAESFLRQSLSTAPEPVYRQCLELVQQRLFSLAPVMQARLGMLFPDEAEFSDQLIFSLTANPPAPSVAHWLQLSAHDPAALAMARNVDKDGRALFCTFTEVATTLQEKGVDALEFFIQEAHLDNAGTGLTAIGLPDALEALAKVAGTSKQALARLTLAVDRWPAAAMVGLAKAVSGNSRNNSRVVLAALMQLLRAYPQLPDQLQLWLEPAAQQALTRAVQQMQAPAMATAAELPSVLVNPPWLKKAARKTQKALDLAVLELDSVEYWAEGERERQAQFGSREKWFEEIKKSSQSLLHGLGFYRLDKSEKASELDTAAERALQEGDGLALSKIWLENIEVRRACEERFSLSVDAMYICAMSSEKTAIEFANAGLSVALKNPSIFLYNEARLFARYGIAVVPVVTALSTSRSSEGLQHASNFGVVALAPIAARAFTKLKKLKDLGKNWLLRFPEHAVCGLIAPALGKPGEARDCAANALRFLALQGQEALILEVAGRYQQAEVVESIRLVLNEDPLDLFPSKRTKMPEFWQPTFWRRPVLKNGLALPDQALDHLGAMMTFPTQDGMYAGLKQVKEVCTSESLANFLSDLFSAWLYAGGSSKDNWALTMQGYLGNDDTARELTPFIRHWPGELAHARAVVGLDVLANIGTDVSLMMLNGIAQKLKFKALQDKAREKINEIAESRDLTLEELEDRLAPDLDLDANGSLILDFGPRQFKVGFDESLKPYVREMEGGRVGARLADLPKPKKSDDAELGKAAVERFKLLKKDARTIASQQVLRLETAMCSRRRWTDQVFQQFLVEHPLLRHLVQRLVWGVYRCAEDESYGGELLSGFRVSEDGSFTTADDDAYCLPEGNDIKIGLPHALELPAESAAAFGQLFTDYELLQPFAQLGRDVHALTDVELASEKLERWKDKVVPTGRVLGLANKGWRRGEAQDSGCIWYFTKAIAGGRYIELNLEPGIIVGMVDEYPEQTLGSLGVTTQPGGWSEAKSYRFNTLDSIVLSELIRDMEALCEGPGK